MDKSLLALIKRAQEAVADLKPFDSDKTVENAESKSIANQLLLLAIEKMETE